MKYRGYEINQDSSGFAPKHSQFYYTEEDEEEIIGYAESVDECKKEIDELIKELSHENN
jgi:hypothetical protein